MAINLDDDIMAALTGEKITWPQALAIRDDRKAVKAWRRKATNATLRAEGATKTADALDAKITALLK